MMGEITHRKFTWTWVPLDTSFDTQIITTSASIEHVTHDRALPLDAQRVARQLLGVVASHCEDTTSICFRYVADKVSFSLFLRRRL